MEKIKTTDQLIEEITKRKDKLLLEADKNGLYENFGQKEVREIENKLDLKSNRMKDITEAHEHIREFEYWCKTLDLRKLRKYKEEGYLETLKGGN